MSVDPGMTPAGGRETIDGYVADSHYPSAYHAAFDPAAIDAALEIHGYAPPRDGRAPFRLVDLGCGDGIGLMATAAGHPEGHFTGIDAHAGHVATGQAAVADCGLANVEVLAGTFAQPPELASGAADYVTAQGVLAWISPANRGELVALAARLLKPGGVLVVGYNAMPGWQLIAPYQRLVRAMAEAREGTPVERYENARDQIRRLGLAEQGIWDWFDKLPKDLPRDYFPHEYLNGHWQPLWSGDVVEMLAAVNLSYVGQMSPERLRPDLTLRSACREALAEIEELAAREIATDLMLNSWFRTDIYVKGEPPALSHEAKVERRLARHWFARSRSDDHGWSAKTSAGTIRFDNAAARAILAKLRLGPAPLAAVDDIGTADLVNTADALLIANLIGPCEAPGESGSALAFNRWRARSRIEFNAVVGRHGVIPVPHSNSLASVDAATAARLGLDALLPAPDPPVR